MRIKDLFAAAGAFALTVAPALAQAAGDPLARTSAPLEDASGMGGSSSLLIIALVVALGIGIYFITKNDNDPDSP